ncbi:MAG: glycosyltransferase family 4 protein [Enhygromyxa sp.]
MKPRLIGICFNAYGTGLTRVMHEILFPLADEYEIHYLAIGYSGPRYEDRGVHIHPTNPKGGDVFGAFQARDMILELEPELVFLLHDIWVFRNFTSVFAPVRDRTRFVGYIPLDGRVTQPQLAACLHGLDRAVVYTDWAAKELREAFAGLGEPEPGTAWPPVEVIFHGVDLEHFHPPAALLEADFHHRGRVALKRELFPELPEPEDSFVVLNAARPALRKRVDLTIEGFAKFAADKPANVRLCLHHAYTEDDTRELLELAEARLGDRLIYNPLSPAGGAISEAELNRLYGATDVGINTSMGEGWGLVSFEHAAAGSAQVVPRSSACASLWDDDRALMLEPVTRGIPFFSQLELAEVDAEGVAAALQRLYDDRGHMQALAGAGHRYVHRPEFRWSAIAEQWRSLFAELRERR